MPYKQNDSGHEHMSLISRPFDTVYICKNSGGWTNECASRIYVAVVLLPRWYCGYKLHSSSHSHFVKAPLSMRGLRWSQFTYFPFWKVELWACRHQVTARRHSNRCHGHRHSYKNNHGQPCDLCDTKNEFWGFWETDWNRLSWSIMVFMVRKDVRGAERYAE